AVGQHLRRDVGGDHGPVRRGLLGCGHRRLAVAGPDIEDTVTGLDLGELDESVADRSPIAIHPARPLLPADRCTVPLLPLGSAALGRVHFWRCHLNSPFPWPGEGTYTRPR